MSGITDKFASAVESSDVLVNLGLEYKEAAIASYFLVNIWHGATADVEADFDELIKFVNALLDKYRLPTLLYLHPVIKDKIAERKIDFDPRVRFLPQLGFFDFTKLKWDAKCVISDSNTITEEGKVLGFKTVCLDDDSDTKSVLADIELVLAGGKNK